MLRLRPFRAATFGAGLALLPTALAAQGERYTLAGDRIGIYNLAGDIRVEPGSGPEVVIEVRRGGSEARELRVEQGEIRGRNTLRIIYPGSQIQYTRVGGGDHTELHVRDDGTFSDGDQDDRWRSRGRRVVVSGSRGLDAYADLIVRVPAGRNVAIYLAAGTLAASDVQADLLLDGASASATVSSHRGALDIDVGSGGVTVTGVQGNLVVDTGSGDVQVSGVRGSTASIDTGSGEVVVSDMDAAELSIDTGSGGVRLDGLRARHIVVDTGSGGVSLTLLAAPEALTVDTGSGEVVIRAPADLSARVALETSSGDIETDFPVTVTRHATDELNGTIGGGRGTMTVETGSGDIRLVRAE